MWEEREEGRDRFSDSIFQESFFEFLGSRLLDLPAKELFPEGLGVAVPDTSVEI